MQLHNYLLFTTLVAYSQVSKILPPIIYKPLAYIFQGLNEEQLSYISSVAQKCEQDSNVSLQLSHDLANHKIPDVSKYYDNEPLRKYILCVHTKAGFLNKDGSYNIKALKKWIKDGVDSDEKADELIQKCVAKRETLEDTAFDTFNCFYYNDNDAAQI